MKRYLWTFNPLTTHKTTVGTIKEGICLWTYPKVYKLYTSSFSREPNHLTFIREYEREREGHRLRRSFPGTLHLGTGRTTSPPLTSSDRIRLLQLSTGYLVNLTFLLNWLWDSLTDVDEKGLSISRLMSSPSGKWLKGRRKWSGDGEVWIPGSELYEFRRDDTDVRVYGAVYFPSYSSR